MEKKNISIFCLLKDTPNYLVKSWIEHHFNLGINDIYICIDYNSNDIYKDERVEYIIIDKDLKDILDDGKNFKSNTYNYFLNKLDLNEKYDWIAFIDDDEFLQFDTSVLTNYTDCSYISLPWNLRGTMSLKIETDLSKYFDITKKKYLYLDKCGFYKRIFNTNFLRENSLDINEPEYIFITQNNEIETYSDEKSILPVINEAKKYMHIDHYMVRSFEEWVSKLFNRGNIIKEYNVEEYYNGQRFVNYFDIYDLIDKYNTQDVYEMLKKIDRLDVFDFKNFPLEKPYEDIKKHCAVCLMCKDSNEEILKYVINTYLDCGVDDVYVVIDKNSKPIYKYDSEHVHYINYTNELNEEVMFYSSFAQYNECSKEYIGVFNWLYKKLRNKYKWIGFFNDDEFLNLDIESLNNFKDYSSVYIPRIAFRLKDNKEKTIEENLSSTNYFIYGRHFYKSFINTEKTPTILTPFFNDMNGITIRKRKLFNQNNIETIKDNHEDYVEMVQKILYSDVLSKNNYIGHIAFTTFKDLMYKLFYRGHVFNEKYDLPQKLRYIVLWFKANNKNFSEETLFNLINENSSDDFNLDEVRSLLKENIDLFPKQAIIEEENSRPLFGKTEEETAEYFLQQDGYFLTGSRYWFTGMEGFSPHDYDFVKLIDNKEKNIFEYQKINNVCVFGYNTTSKEEIIKLLQRNIKKRRTLSAPSMFFNKNISKKLNFDFIKEYYKIEQAVEAMPQKWNYYKIIAKFFLENGVTDLNFSQKQIVFEEYLKYRT